MYRHSVPIRTFECDAVVPIPRLSPLPSTRLPPPHSMIIRPARPSPTPSLHRPPISSSSSPSLLRPREGSGQTPRPPTKTLLPVPEAYPSSPSPDPRTTRRRRTTRSARRRSRWRGTNERYGSSPWPTLAGLYASPPSLSFPACRTRGSTCSKKKNPTGQKK